MKNTKTTSVTSNWYGLRLLDVREAMGLSVEQLAQRTGLMTVHIKKFESGEIQPSLTDALVIAGAMRLSILDFIPDTAPEQCRARVTRRQLRW